MSTFVLATGTVDPESEVKTREVGEDKKKVTNFRIATDPGWYTVDAWGDLGQQVPAPGTFVIVTGRLNTRSFEGDNGKVTLTSIVASSIQVPGIAAPQKQLQTNSVTPKAADLDPMFAD